MDTLLRERSDGTEEIWYSESYVRAQIETAYRAGLHKGIKVQFHSVTPMDGEMVDDLTKEFEKRIKEEYNKAFENSEVWKIGK